MMKSLKNYGLTVMEALYGASVTSVLAFSALIFLMVIIAIALDMKAIDVQQLHLAPPSQ